MHELFTEVQIDAPAELVWKVLTDFESYGEWNPYIPAISGDLEVGRALKVHASPSGTLGRTFFPEVVRVDPPREFRWVGRLPISGLLDGEHIFALEPLAQHSVRLIHREEFSGPMAFLHKWLRMGATRRGFMEMNAALRTRAESLFAGQARA